jgi:hypothetical protein
MEATDILDGLLTPKATSKLGLKVLDLFLKMFSGLSDTLIDQTANWAKDSLRKGIPDIVPTLERSMAQERIKKDMFKMFSELPVEKRNKLADEVISLAIGRGNDAGGK